MIIDSPIISGSQLSSGPLTQVGDVYITGSLNVLGAINGSITGSITSASYATNAEFLDRLDSTSFVFTSSFNDFSGSITGRVTNLEAFSSSLDATFATDASVSASILVLSQSVQASEAALSSSYTITSGSYASASGSLSIRTSNLEATSSTLVSASSSFAADSASLSTRLTGDEANITTLTNASASFAVVSASFVTTSGSIAERVAIIEGQDATTGSNTFTGPQFISQASNAISFTSTASLYTDGGLRVSKDSYVSGTAYFNNITVYGTSSIQYITSSQVNIGSNIITVNTDTPAIRFGGLSVFDSGSTQLTGSIFWDSEKNHWIYSNPSGSDYNSAMLMNGPRNTGSLGSEQGTLANYIMKGQGGDHITSSQIFDDGTTVRIPGNLQVTGSLVGSSTATFASSVRTADRYLWGTATNGTTGQIVTDNTNNYFDYLGTLFIRNASASANRLIISSTGNLTIGSTEGTGSGNLYAGAATFSNNVIAAGTLAATGIFSNGDNTAAAPNQFQVSGVANTNKQLLIGYNTSGSGYGSIQAIFQGVGYTNLTLNPSGGNVGIGITNPAYKLHVVGSSFIGRQNNYGTYDGADADLIISNYNSDNTSILLFNQAGAYQSGLVNYYNNILSLGLNNSNSANSILTSTAINITSTGVGIGINSPNALTEIRINTNDYGNNLMLANSYPASGVATSISFSHNTQAADPDIIARISGYIDDRTSSNRYGSLRFYTATGGTLYQRLTIASTGVPTFTVSGADTRLANFSTTTYNSARGLRINSYQSSNGGQDCAIEFDSGTGGYGGFKLSNSGTPMLTLTATGAATFSSSIGAASAGISSTSITTTPSTTLSTSRGIMVDAATTTNNAFVPIGFSWASSVSTYDPTWGMALKTVSYNAGTADLVFYTGGSVRMTIGNGGGTTFTSGITAGGNLNANNITTFSLTLQGLSTPVSTGLPINAGSGGRTYLLLTSQQWDAGNSTSSTITMIRCGYSGDNFTAVVLASSNPQPETWTQSGGILYVTGNTNFQLDITSINNG